MTVTAELTSLDDHRVRLDVSVPEEDVRQAAQSAVRTLGRNIRLPGFRPGKAPTQMIMSAVGRDAVVERMIRDSLGEWYAEALDATGVQPIDDPELDLPEVTDEGPIAFSATVRRRPAATLGEYRGLDVVRQDTTVTDEMLGAEIERLRVQLGRLEEAPRAAAAGDFLTIDFDGSLDGEPLPTTTGRDFVVEIGGGRVIAGFDDALVGASAGETRTFDITYPDDEDRGELSGKTVTFTATVSRVQERVLPQIDDAFASEAAGFDSLADLRADMTERLEAALRARADEQFRRSAIDAAVVNATLEVPAVMVDRRVESVLHDTSHQLPQGVTLDDYLAARGTTLERARKDLRPDAEMSIRRELVVEAVMVAEGVVVTDEDVEAKVVAEAQEAGRNAKDIMKALRRSGNIEVLREDMARERAVDILVEGAVPITPELAAAREKLVVPKANVPAAPTGEIWTPGGPTKATTATNPTPES